MKLTAPALLLLCAPATSPAQTGWQLDADGRVHAAWFTQQSRAGDDGVTATSWLMLEAARGADNTFAVHAMISPDAIINGDCGQPRLFPETFDCGDAEALSHPLVMELSAKAQFRLSPGLTISAKAGPVGEPAFGPAPHFMRTSAAYDPAPPLMHHLFTPSHSAHGFVTAGVHSGALGVEVSAFNGRHVADRYQLDLAPPDAWAARISVIRSAALTAQLSVAHFTAQASGAHHGHAGDMRAFSLTVAGSTPAFAYTAGCAAHRIAGELPYGCVLEATAQASANVSLREWRPASDSSRSRKHRSRPMAHTCTSSPITCCARARWRSATRGCCPRISASSHPWGCAGV